MEKRVDQVAKQSLEAWEQAEREQTLHIARNTTPLQRVQWLEQMMELFREQILNQRDREERGQQNG